MTVLIGLVTIAIVTRSLGAEHFGEYTTAVTFLQFFGVLVDFGLTLTLIVMISEAGVDEERIVGNFFGLRLVSGFLLFSLAPLFVLALPWSTTVKQAVLVGAVAYFLMGGASMLVGIFQKHEAMWRNSVAEFINRIFLTLFIALVAFFHLGVVAMVGSTAVASAVWLFAMIRFAKPFVRVRPLFEKKIWLQIFSRSWPIAISIIFNLMYLKGDVLLLAYFRTQTEVGLYGVAYRILDVLTVVPTMFMGLILPSLVTAWTTGEHDRFKNRLSRTFDLFMIGIIPVIVGTQVVGGRLIQLIAGREYQAGGNILNILILATLGVFISTLFGHLIVALNKQRIMIWGYATGAVLTLIGYVYFIPLYGMTGAAWMTVFSETLIALITFTVVYRTVHSAPHPKVLLKVCAASAIMYAFLRFIPSTNVLLAIFFGAVVYAIVLVALKGISMEDAKILLPERFRRK